MYINMPSLLNIQRCKSLSNEQNAKQLFNLY